MLDISKLTSPIEKLIIEHGSAAVRQDIISLVKEQLGIANQKISELEKSNAELSQKVNDLEKTLAAAVVPKDFIEHRGVLFRRVNGSISLTDVYCPTCKIVMFSIGGGLPFMCSKCKFQAGFNGMQLSEVVSSMPQ